MIEICKNCEAYAPDKGYDNGKCRRHAPVVTRIQDLANRWPLVNHDDWCLEFLPRESQKHKESAWS